MAYDDLKEFHGQKYSGMPVGGTHIWNYVNGVWKEKKIAPDRWMFRFESIKRRKEKAPLNSGAPIDTQYHWYILADQLARKVDKDTYETTMDGVKFKIAHKRPYWRKWSSEYPNNISDRDRIIAILEDILEQMKGCRQGVYQNVAAIYLQIL